MQRGIESNCSKRKVAKLVVLATGAVISIEGTCEGDMGQQRGKAPLERKREIAHGKHMQRKWFCSVALRNESM